MSPTLRFRVLVLAGLACAFVFGCRSPVSSSSDRADLTLRFALSGAGAAGGVRPAGPARLILASAACVRVSLAPADSSQEAPPEQIVDLSDSSASATFPNLRYGTYTLTAEALESRSSNAVRFKRTRSVEVRSSNVEASLRLFPVNSDGSEYAQLSAAGTVPVTLAPNESRTWIIPTDTLASGFANLLASAPADVGLYGQTGDGTLLAGGPASRRICRSGTGLDETYVTAVNGGAFPRTFDFLVSFDALAARWNFDGADAWANQCGGTPSSMAGSAARSGSAAHASDFGLALDGASYLSLVSAYAELSPPWTVAVWAYRPAAQSASVEPFLLGTSSNIVRLAQGSNFRVGVSAGGTDHDFGSSLPLDAWTHAALVNDGTSVRLYLNGAADPIALDASTAASFNLPLSSLGADGSGSRYSGYLDDVRTYTRALAAGEIRALRDAAPLILSIGASANGTVARSPDTQYFEKGDTVTLTAVPANAAWVFDHWDGDASGTANPLTLAMDAGKAVVPVFSEAHFSLGYDYNGGTFYTVPSFYSAEPTGQSGLTAGASVGIGTGNYTIIHPSNPLLYFSGWNTASDGTGTHYQPGSSVVMPTHDVVLFADWRADDFPDNRVAASVLPAVLTGSGTVEGFVQKLGDVDCIRVTFPNSGEIICNVSDSMPMFSEIRLQDSDGANVSSTTHDINTFANNPIVYSVNAGDYYLLVLRDTFCSYNPTGSGPYKVTLTYTPDV